jgi:hypothetical protein
MSSAYITLETHLNAVQNYFQILFYCFRAEELISSFLELNFLLISNLLSKLILIVLPSLQKNDRNEAFHFL